MNSKKKVYIYDTTLRDGSQAAEVSFSLSDKLLIAEWLDDLGVDYIEGGWPGSNPKDASFFKDAAALKFNHARIAAFGSTRHPNNKTQDDPNIKLLLESNAPILTVVGKSWDRQTQDALRISESQNLELIHQTIEYLSARVDEVIFDAEHFYDGYKSNSAYALETIKTAFEAGAASVTLCETNGGALPSDVATITAEALSRFPGRLFGVHAHNDSDCAVANSIVAVEAGSRLVQGTLNGIGERCGNANLLSIIPNLELKMGFKTIGRANMKKMKRLSRSIYDLANLPPRPNQPYVGSSAFAHKGGIHVSAIRKKSYCYEHIKPELVGARRKILISDLSGRANLLTKAEEFGLEKFLAEKKPAANALLKRLKDLESQGYQFEGADASFELMMKKALGLWEEKFKVLRARVVSNFSDINGSDWAEAVIKIELPNGESSHAVAEGNGPVNALDKAARAVLSRHYPELDEVELLDFRVRLVDQGDKTASVTRVTIEAGDSKRRWSVVGVSGNVIEAAWIALMDSLEYRLHLNGARKKAARARAVK